MNFFDVKFGKDAAEQDDQLINYFSYHPKWSQILEGQYRYIIGGKGTGKTAILKMIELKYSNSAIICKPSLEDFVPLDFDDLADTNRKLKYQYTNIWIYLILTELLRNIVQDKGVKKTAVYEIHDFLEKIEANSYTFFQSLKVINHADSSSRYGLNQVLDIGKKTFKSNATEKQKVVLINRLNDKLFDLLNLVESDVKYYFLFDGLDDGLEFKENKNYKYILLSLIDSIEKIVRKTTRNNIRIHFLTAIRSDIFNSLEDSDLNKLDDHTLRLKWDREKIKKIAELRIASSIPKLENSNKIWKSVCEPGNNNIPKRLDNFRHVYRRTSNKPRNFIKYLRICQENDRFQPLETHLSRANILDSEARFSDWLYREYRDEMHGLLPIWDHCLTIFSKEQLEFIDREAFLSKMSANKSITSWCEKENVDHNFILERLFSYGVIGCVGSLGNEVWAYNDDKFIYGANKFRLDPGLLKALNINTGSAVIKYNLNVSIVDEFTDRYFWCIDDEVDVLINKSGYSRRKTKDRLFVKVMIGIKNPFPRFSDVQINARFLNSEGEYVDDIEFFVKKSEITYKRYVIPMLCNKSKYAELRLISKEKVLKPNYFSGSGEEEQSSTNDYRAIFEDIQEMVVEVKKVS